ncbi:MAG: SIS domain-containing protein [Deltaproteobacteria bacterium]|nr:MAG: SIS domain-containing protein [Deltaproteobacteria bacterium]
MTSLKHLKSPRPVRCRLPRISIGKHIRSVPPGTIVLFPLQDTVLNCGLTGIVTVKRKESSTASISIEKLTSLAQGLEQFTLKRLPGKDKALTERYLGGEAIVGKLKGFVSDLKRTASLYELFKKTSAQNLLEGISRRLEAIITGEERELQLRPDLQSLRENEVVEHRISQAKDLVWSLREEILANLKKIEALSARPKKNISFLAFQQIKNINTLFNNLDRLEVRGRDSAGISIITCLDKRHYDELEKELKRKSLLEEFISRQQGVILLNRGITVSEGGGAISVTLTYKIAAQIGHLGDNVAFLRDQVRTDDVFHCLISRPNLYQTMLAHTRWASVGEISESNCHPVDNRIGPNGTEHSYDGKHGVIHACLNGDIDNYVSLKGDFERNTTRSIPEQVTTDTKIIPLQIQHYCDKGHPLEEAFRLAVNDFKGSHAIAMHTDIAPGKIFLAQRGSGQTIFVGLGGEQLLAASEIYGLVEETARYVKMEGEKAVNGESQGQIFILDQDSAGELSGIKALHYDGTVLELAEDAIHETEIASRDIDRQAYSHYFLKEIFESPESVRKTVQTRWRLSERDGNRHAVSILDDTVIPRKLATALTQGKIKKVLFIGQGTAGVSACGCAELLRYYLADTDIRILPLKASEFSGNLSEDDLSDTLVIAVTQSGTTTDTNLAVDMAKERGAYTLALVNRRDSDITFKVDGVLYTSTGRDIEMSVASTKAYYSQIAAGSILGLKLAQMTSRLDDAVILGELQRLMKLPSIMKKVLALDAEIAQSAHRFASSKKYWAVVGSGYNKIAADEIRIKLSELCYKTISSDVVEDKKHIDLSSEPLIVICAAGHKGTVINDIIKDTAIFKAHQATTIVIATEGEEGFKPYADSLIFVPQIEERFSPIVTTLAGHLWGYHAARAIDAESGFLFNFREEINKLIAESKGKGLDIYQIILDRVLREKAARFFAEFKKRLELGRYTTALGLAAASRLTLLLKYLSGRLPMSDFETDFGESGTAPHVFDIFFRCIGEAINDMARPIDAIRHQAKTVTVGTSRSWEPVTGLLFEAIMRNGFEISDITNKNVLVLKNLQEVISEIHGETLYKINNLSYSGEPVEDSTIELVSKKGSSSRLVSRVEGDTRLKGTKRIIVQAGNVFIGKGRIDARSVLIIPVMQQGPNIDHLFLLDVGFNQDAELPTKVLALGEKGTHIRNIVEETGLAWADDYLNLLPIQELFGNSAEKTAEFIIASVKNNRA